MTDVLEKKLWSTENVIKLFGLFAMLTTQYYLIKQEIHDNKTNYDADQRIINYRLSKIEDCCNLKTQVAILPKEPNIETERK